MAREIIPNLESMLSAKGDSLQIAKWLREVYLPTLGRRFNTPDSRKRLGLYLDERIPENERNLTDVRNRISLIIEYELARISNDIIAEHDLPNLFWSYVVANRFPDLEIRERDGNRHLRIEVKCLQSVAEEKSANFDTLKKDIHPDTDFVLVFLWEWAYDKKEFNWDQAPLLLDHFVFHAYSLAELRDHYWLNRPPTDLGGGYQGFDLRYAVNCSKNHYNEEEGNYGKLLRIWQADFPYRPRSSPVLLDTEKEYLRLKEEAVNAGFRSLAKKHLPLLSGDTNILPILNPAGASVGAASGEFGFFQKAVCSNPEVMQLMHSKKLRFAVLLTDKYVCTGVEAKAKKLEQKFNKLKPKLLSRRLFGLA